MQLGQLATSETSVDWPSGVGNPGGLISAVTDAGLSTPDGTSLGLGALVPQPSTDASMWL